MSSTGTIVVNVYTSDARLPLERATVLFRQEAQPGKLLGFRQTDSSGQTTPLIIDTVDASVSQIPEDQVEPWTGLTLKIEHPDYESLLIRGVQVFPGVTTIQNVPLLPLSQHDPDKDGIRDFTISPQSLWEDAT